jgi:predicted GNAT family acetyltransferase
MTTATMPRITDSTRVHSVLNLDRAWAAYAIGDLAPEFASDCSWYAPDDGSPALLLLYRGFDPPIAFAMGEASQLAPLFGEMDASKVSLHVRSDAITALLPAYRPTQTREMWRMVVDPASFRSVTTDAVVALDESDLAAISALYEDGRQHDETPTFFYPWMLRQGTFRGIREGSDLIAVAGTHLYSQELGVCAVGNVYTRRDRRRQGLGARVTSAVVEHAMSHAIPTIVLNVGQRNRGARRLYEQLGFRGHCDFLEGEAEATS